MFPVHRQISPHATGLRRAQTDVEQRFWMAVRNRRLDGYKFRRQASIGPFVADFLCVEAMLVVELDGGQHDDVVDAGRTRFLQGCGYAVLRFWNNDVAENMKGVLLTVKEAARQRTADKKKILTRPSPAKAGEG